MILKYTLDLLGNLVEVWEPEQSDEYSAYIASAKWKIKARAALARADHKCQKCGRTKWSSRLEVHHKTYERFKNEHPEDLEVLCVECHAKADEQRRTVVAVKKQRKVFSARMNGWARKVYGENWNDRIDADTVRERFEDWLSERDFDGL